MLSIYGNGRNTTCQGTTRRELLKVGSLALGGWSLPQLLAQRAAGAPLAPYLRDKSIVLLFLHGGPSHIEFFDPKMTAPSEIRSITGEVATRTPGITFGGTFSRLAERMDRFSIIRSYGSRNGGHTYEAVSTGGNPLKAAMSAMYARVAGSHNPVTGIPQNIHIKPEAVDSDLKLRGNFETGALPTVVQPGGLGPSYAAFDPSGGDQVTDSMELRIPQERLQDRRLLLAGLDRLRRQADGSGSYEMVDKQRVQAFEIISRGIARAFDLSHEDPSTLALYDTSHIFRAEELQRYYDMSRTTNLLGQQMLLARRLCEAGCGFVTVSDCGWDMHANNNSPKGMTGIWPMGNQVDHAVSAFLDDVEQRGLSDKILLIVTGEMGRTPRINRDGGRDHYGELTPLLFAGGGLRMGQVIGASDRTASRAATDPYTPEHLLGTVMHTLFDVAQLRLDASVPGDVARVILGSRPIEPLMG